MEYKYNKSGIVRHQVGCSIYKQNVYMFGGRVGKNEVEYIEKCGVFPYVTNNYAECNVLQNTYLKYERSHFYISGKFTQHE